jgi:hypothetical protein
MPAADYQSFLARHNFRQSDGAWMVDATTRMGAYYAINGVSGAPALIIMAVDEGLISLDWLVSKIVRKIP